MKKEANNYSVYKIEYVKANGEKSEREIIKFGEPRDTLLALEVTTLEDHQRKALTEFLLKQKAELAEAMSAMGVEFKSFKPEGVTYLGSTGDVAAA